MRLICKVVERVSAVMLYGDQGTQAFTVASVRADSILLWANVTVPMSREAGRGVVKWWISQPWPSC